MTETNMATKISQFVELRDYKKAMKTQFNASMQRVDDAMEILEGQMLTILNEQEGKSFNAADGSGTAYLKPYTSCSVQEADTFLSWCANNQRRDALDVRANKKVVEEILNSGVDVPGVKFTKMNTVGVRRGKKS